MFNTVGKVVPIERFLLVSPHYAFFVGLSIMSLVYCINYLGDFLHKKWDIKNNDKK